MTSRQRQAVETKQKILDSAARLMDQRGYDSVSVDDVVADCGVAKGTFYHYFKSKEDLLVYFTHTPYEQLSKKLESTVGRPFGARMRAFINDWFEIMDKFNLYFARQSLSDNPLSRGEFGGGVSHMTVGMEQVRSLLLCGIDSGELPRSLPVEELTREIMFSMYGSTLYHCMCPDTFDVMDWARSFTDIVFDSLLSPYIQ